MAKVEEIEIHAGEADFAFKPIRRLEVKCEASNALMPAPTIEEANGRLRALAVQCGANAVVGVDYKTGISFTSWKSLKATGLAVIRESDEVFCPMCAEAIKRAAVKCRFCGADQALTQAINSPSESDASSSIVVESEPLRDNNNPAIVIGLIFLGLVVLSIVMSAA